ncbi:enoyl-CoA hydratase [Streptomyces fulvoviolaceus]|uniref:enoyl-CoA hydratase n=1 Tax=Streptomyces fulvoviolaceus TaxID=285535 RepID=UPI0004C8A57B|nr:enoyl-CoA hydratase [Streptomyces fulvoviolaceus]
MSETVLVADVGSVRILTMNRPEARNALGGELISALYTGLVDSDSDPEVRAVVLTGVDPAFCAGVDLKQAAREGEAYFRRHREEPCVQQVARMTTPVIGAINGATFTGGLEIALGCDFLVASERAVFADTHARVGVLPGGGMTARLPGVVGQAWARRMSFTGEVIGAAEALRIGLVTEVVAHDALLDRAIELATAVTEVPHETMRTMKRIYREGGEPTIGAALAVEQAISEAHRPDLGMLEDRRRAVTARNRDQL